MTSTTTRVVGIAEAGLAGNLIFSLNSTVARLHRTADRIEQMKADVERIRDGVSNRSYASVIADVVTEIHGMIPNMPIWNLIATAGDAEQYRSKGE